MESCFILYTLGTAAWRARGYEGRQIQICYEAGNQKWEGATGTGTGAGAGTDGGCRRAFLARGSHLAQVVVSRKYSVVVSISSRLASGSSNSKYKVVGSSKYK